MKIIIRREDLTAAERKAIADRYAPYHRFIAARMVGHTASPAGLGITATTRLCAPAGSVKCQPVTNMSRTTGIARS
jgi:hypothetical protein